MIVARSAQSGRCLPFWLADPLPPQIPLQYTRAGARFLQSSDSLWRTADASALHRRGNANAQSSRDSRRARREQLGIISLQAVLGETGIFIKISKFAFQIVK